MKIATWNIEGRLAGYLQKPGRGTPEKIIKEIANLDADVIVLPEFYNGTAMAFTAKKELQELGYEWLETAYNDPDREEEIALYGKSHIAILSRIGFISKDIIRFGGIRDLPVAVVRDPVTKKSVRIIGAHLEDRSEARRQQQLNELTPFINKQPMPTVLLGDLNALWPGIRASIITSFIVRFVAIVLPYGNLRSELSRLIEMARGTTMKRLRDEAHLNETDKKRQPTVTPKKRNLPYLPGVPLCQIDHILISSDMKSTDFKVAKDGGSDHRAISVTIAIKNE